MRVISGTAKGRVLKAPEGLATRPMADRVKESLFNILAVLGFPTEDDRVLDLYAGTGALGIEALSRGDAWADFVEQASEPARCIRANLAATGFAGQAAVHPIQVTTFLRGAGNLTINGSRGHNGGRYDIIFCDPPYADPAVPAVVAELAAWSGLDPAGVLIVGHARQVEMPDALGPLARVRYRRWGGSAFSLYRRDQGSAAGDPGQATADEGRASLIPDA